MTTRLLAFLILVCSAFGAHAVTYYVDVNSPSDPGGCAAWATACDTIAEGIAQLSAGDVLKIRTGTYPEPLDMTISGTSGSIIRIESDDGAGNPGSVTITGRVQRSGIWTGILVNNASYVTIDGRQEDGFIVDPVSATEFGVWTVSGTDAANSNVVFRYITVTGSLSGTEPASFAVQGLDDPEVAYCKIDQVTGTSWGIEVWCNNGGFSTNNPCGGGQVHHNTLIDVRTSAGYSGISILRHDDADIYSNYIEGISQAGQGSNVMRVRQGNRNDFYNNVVYIKPGDIVDTIFQWRGMTDGSGVADSNRFFNNTIHVLGTADAPLLVNDVSTNNEIYNNLIISSAGFNDFVVSWGQDTGSNNETHDNHVTGPVTNWFYANTESVFSVTGPDYDNIGTSNITLAGARPDPHYVLTGEIAGTSVGAPSDDFNQDPRGGTISVGAFEFDSGASPGLSLPNTPRSRIGWSPGALFVPR